MDEKRCAKPIAAQRIGPLEISHALRSEGRNEETRDGRETGAQVNRITDDRLDRVRSDEVLEAFGWTGPRATPRRNAGPVDQIASPSGAPVRRSSQAPSSQWPRHPVRRGAWAVDRSSIVRRFAGSGSCTKRWESSAPRCGRSPLVGRQVASVTGHPTPVADTAPAPAGDNDTARGRHRTRFGGGQRHRTWGARPLRRRGIPQRTRDHLGGAGLRTRRSTQQLVLPAAGRISTRGPLELILRGALTFRVRAQPRPSG